MFPHVFDLGISKISLCLLLPSTDPDSSYVRDPSLAIHDNSHQTEFLPQAPPDSTRPQLPPPGDAAARPNPPAAPAPVAAPGEILAEAGVAQGWGSTNMPTIPLNSRRTTTIPLDQHIEGKCIVF